MTKDAYLELIETLDSEVGASDFRQAKNPLHKCPDICGIMLLASLAPHPEGTYPEKAVSWVGYEQIFLTFDPDVAIANMTEEQARLLYRTGVFLDREQEAFSLFT